MGSVNQVALTKHYSPPPSVGVVLAVVWPIGLGGNMLSLFL